MSWLGAVVALLHSMRAEGVPIVGLVWWPLFDFVDWSFATGDQVIEEFYSWIDGEISPIFPPRRGAGIDAYFRRMGLFRLEADGADIRQRADTGLPNISAHTRAATQPGR